MMLFRLTSGLAMGALVAQSREGEMNHEYGTQKDGSSRVESLQYELRESSRECQAAEMEALRLWEEHQQAEDRSLMLEKVASQRSAAHGANALRAAMLEWQQAQEHAAELWARYAEAEERAGVLRDEEEDDTQQGHDVVLAEEETHKMRAQAEALQHKGSSLKQAVQKWQAAEERSSETWSRFMDKKSERKARLATVASTDHAVGVDEQDFEDEVEIERVLAEADQAAESAKHDADVAIPANLAAHLKAATELVGAAKDVAKRLVEASAKAEAHEVANHDKDAASVKAEAHEVANSEKDAAPQTAKTEATNATEATAELFSGSISSQSSSTTLGRFSGQPESFTDLIEKFPAPLGGPDGFSVAFTARWDKLNRWSRVIDFGSGVGDSGHGGNNIIIANEKMSDAFAFHIYGNTSNACLTIPGIIKVGTDTRYLCSVDSEGHMRVYQEGRLVGEKKNGLVPPAVHREHLYIGKSNFKGNGMFEGEVRDLCVWNAAVTWDDTEGCASS